MGIKRISKGLKKRQECRYIFLYSISLFFTAVKHIFRIFPGLLVYYISSYVQIDKYNIM